MRIRRFTWGAALLVLVSGCSPSASYRPIVGPDAPASQRREPGCDFQVLRAADISGLHFTPLGTLDLMAFWPGAMPRTEAEFREAVAEKVCRAGGDAIIPGIDASGRYVLGNVLLLTDDASEATGAEAEADETPSVEVEAVQAILEGESAARVDDASEADGAEASPESGATSESDATPESDASETEASDAE